MRTRSRTEPRIRATTVGPRSRQIEKSLNAVCIGGFDGYLRQVSPLVAQVLGYTPEEMLRVPMLELVHPDERERTREFIDRLLAGERTWESEVRSAHQGRQVPLDSMAGGAVR